MTKEDKDTIFKILVEIENILVDHAAYRKKPFGFNKIGLRSAPMIMITAIMDNMWQLQENEDIPIETRAAMAEKCGNDLRNLIKTYTDIDTHKLYKEEI